MKNDPKIVSKKIKINKHHIVKSTHVTDALKYLSLFNLCIRYYIIIYYYNFNKSF